MKAIGIIQDEHRAIAAVLQGLRHLVEEVGAGRMAADHGLFGAMLHYIEAFPEKLHHPKEDDYLFARLRARRPDAAPLLDALEREHVAGDEHLRELKALWERYRGDPGACSAFAEGLERYAQFHWQHMRKEEDEVLPLARESLTADDWAVIDAAFASNDDPVVGVPASESFRELFKRIVTIAPPPWGVGPEVRQ